MPIYWMDLDDPKLNKSMQSLLSSEKNLSADEMSILKNYFRGWIKGINNEEQKLNNIDDKKGLITFLKNIKLDYGIQPLG